MGTRTNAAQTIRDKVRVWAQAQTPPLPVLRHGRYLTQDPSEDTWIRVDLLSSVPFALAGGPALHKRRKETFIFQVNVFTRFAEDDDGADSLRADRIADDLRELFAGESVRLENLDTNTPGGGVAAPNFQGWFQCDDGSVTPIPEDSRNPGVVGYAVSFTCELFPV